MGWSFGNVEYNKANQKGKSGFFASRMVSLEKERQSASNYFNFKGNESKTTRVEILDIVTNPGWRFGRYFNELPVCKRLRLEQKTLLVVESQIACGGFL